MDESKEEHFVGKIAQKAIILKGGKVLLTRDPRSPGGEWEIPGGRMNVDEEPRAALARELHEELGVEFAIHEVVHMEQFWHQSDGRSAFMIAYRATIKDEEAPFTMAEDEVAEVRWVGKNDLPNVKLFPEYRRSLEIFFANTTQDV